MKSLSQLLTTSMLTTIALGLMSTPVLAEAPPAGVKLAPVQKITRNLRSFPATIDPNMVSDDISGAVVRATFDTLARQGRNGNFVPVAAQSWEVSDDGKTWTFHLRPEAKWQDGKPVTAHDFVYSWRRLTDPNTAAPYGNYLALANVVNAAQVNAGKAPVTSLGVEAPDDLTFVVHLEYPTPWLPQMIGLSATAPVRQDLIEKYGDNWTSLDHLVGNGPYLLKKYNVNDVIEQHKWDGYWDAKNVTLTDIKSIFINNLNTAYYKYLTGELIITTIPNSLNKVVAKERPEEVVQTPELATRYYLFNTTNPKLQDPRVRKALVLLTNTKFLVDHILSAGHASSIFVPTYVSEGQLATEAPYISQSMKDRQAEARKLLKEAGYSQDHPLRLSMMITKSDTSNKVFVATSGFWKQGSDDMIILEPNVQEWKTFLDQRKNKNFEVSIAGWGADYNQASTFYNILTCTDTNNDSGWCNTNFDNLISQAARNLDPQQRANLYAQANQVLQDQNPIIPGWWGTYNFLKSPALGGYTATNNVRYPRDFYLIADKHIKSN